MDERSVDESPEAELSGDIDMLEPEGRAQREPAPLTYTVEEDGED